MKKRTETVDIARVLIYVRYLLPIFLCVAMLAFALVPCLQYSTVSGTNDKISTLELFENSWDQVRNYLFSGGETKADQERFSWIMLTLLIVMAISFVVGTVSTVAVAFCALRFIREPDRRLAKEDTVRMWFVTIVPNRTVACILFALTLPLTFLSRIIIPLYDKIMSVDVLLNVSFPEPWVFSLIFLAITVALSIASAHYEKKLKSDVFEKKKNPKKNALGRYDEEQESPMSDEERREYEEQRARQEELIRNILGKNNEDENK